MTFLRSSATLLAIRTDAAPRQRPSLVPSGAVTRRLAMGALVVALIGIALFGPPLPAAIILLVGPPVALGLAVHVAVPDGLDAETTRIVFGVPPAAR